MSSQHMNSCCLHVSIVHNPVWRDGILKKKKRSAVDKSQTRTKTWNTQRVAHIPHVTPVAKIKHKKKPLGIHQGFKHSRLLGGQLLLTLQHRFCSCLLVVSDVFASMFVDVVVFSSATCGCCPDEWLRFSASNCSTLWHKNGGREACDKCVCGEDTLYWQRDGMKM